MANITVEEVILHLTSPLHRCPYLSDNPGDNPGGGLMNQSNLNSRLF